MNSFTSNRKPFLLAILMIGGVINVTPDVYASSSFNGYAELTYDLSGADLSGISVSSYFDYIDDASYGDGTWFPSFTQNANTDKFQVSGFVNVGEVNASYNGGYFLTLVNGSADARMVDVNVSYLLQASVAGENAQSTVQLEHASGYDEAYVSVFGDSDLITVFGLTDTFSFMLAGNSQETFHVLNLGVVGNVFSSNTTTVPIPPAAWSFLMGLVAVFGLNKRAKAVK